LEESNAGTFNNDNQINPIDIMKHLILSIISSVLLAVTALAQDGLFINVDPDTKTYFLSGTATGLPSDPPIPIPTFPINWDNFQPYSLGSDYAEFLSDSAFTVTGNSVADFVMFIHGAGNVNGGFDFDSKSVTTLTGNPDVLFDYSGWSPTLIAELEDKALAGEIVDVTFGSPEFALTFRAGAAFCGVPRSSLFQQHAKRLSWARERIFPGRVWKGVNRVHPYNSTRRCSRQNPKRDDDENEERNNPWKYSFGDSPDSPLECRWHLHSFGQLGHDRAGVQRSSCRPHRPGLKPRRRHRELFACDSQRFVRPGSGQLFASLRFTVPGGHDDPDRHGHRRGGQPSHGQFYGDRHTWSRESHANPDRLLPQGERSVSSSRARNP
jgi:hypothetical protein